MPSIFRRTRKIDRLMNVLAVAFLIAAGFMLLRPTTPAGAAVWQKWKQWDGSRWAGKNWDSLAESATRLGGSPETPIVFMLFGDYRCPACRELHRKTAGDLTQLADVAYFHYPLSVTAEKAARAAICAEQQGRFVQMHVYLYEQTDWQAGDWTRVAQNAGVGDITAFTECLSSEATSDRIRRHKEVARRIGVKGTPNMFSRRDGLIRGRNVYAALVKQ